MVGREVVEVSSAGFGDPRLDRVGVPRAHRDSGADAHAERPLAAHVLGQTGEALMQARPGPVQDGPLRQVGQGPLDDRGFAIEHQTRTDHLRAGHERHAFASPFALDLSPSRGLQEADVLPVREEPQVLSRRDGAYDDPGHAGTLPERVVGTGAARLRCRADGYLRIGNSCWSGWQTNPGGGSLPATR
jgi:hypothetical protein